VLEQIPHLAEADIALLEPTHNASPHHASPVRCLRQHRCKTTEMNSKEPQEKLPAGWRVDLELENGRVSESLMSFCNASRLL
jgi:hypothetical protein